MDSINNVCRVCLTTDNLKWIFDRKLHCVQKMNLKNVILTITGVEILIEDILSQKICTRCYRTCIKMYQFRMRARKNNKILKERYNGMLKTSSIVHDIPNNDLTIEKIVEPEMEIKECFIPNYKIHQSVRNILEKFPRLKLPSPWLISNIEPCIILEKDTVENFLKEEIKEQQLISSKPDRIENTSAASIAIVPSLPFMNIETDSANDRFNKKCIEKNSIVSEIVSDNSNNGDSDYELSVIDNIINEPKIRWHTDSEMKDSSSSGPVSKEKSADGSCLDKSVPLLVCSICNSVHDNVKKLERHQLRHLRCQFCRSMFKTIRSMEIHIKSLCAFKNMTNSLPSVKLERIELNQRMRTRYPGAFFDYPEISVKDTEAVGFNGRCTDNDEDVIEILSDEDTTSTTENYISNNTPTHKKEIVPVRNITQSKINRFFLPTNSTATESVSSTIPSVMSTSSVISTTPSIVSSSLSVSSVASSEVSATSSDVSTTSQVIPSRLSSAYTVEPNIRIEDSTVIDRIKPGLSDIESLRRILTDRTALKKESFSQTVLSCSTSICVDEIGGTIVLKNMRNLLVLYYIPIFFKKGNFQARYDYNSNSSKPQQPNKLCLWNDLFPVDIQVGSESSDDEGLVQDRIPVITPEVATEIYSIPGITGNCPETTMDPLNSAFSAVTNLRTYSRNNRFSTPLNSSSGLSNVNVHNQMVSSKSGIVNEDPCSKNLKQFIVRTNTAEQQSNTNTSNYSTASYVQMYLKSANTTYLHSNCLVAKDSTSVHPEGNIAGLQTTHVSYLDDMRSPPNVNPFYMPYLLIPQTSSLARRISTDNASNVSYTDSTRYSPPNYVADQINEPVPDFVPITTTSSSNEAVPGFGSIRVKSLRDLT